MINTEYLKEQILIKDIKYTDIANYLNISKGAVSHILSGTRNPSLSLTIKLIQLLELDPSIFLNLDKRLEGDYKNAK